MNRFGLTLALVELNECIYGVKGTGWLSPTNQSLYSHSWPSFNIILGVEL
jgi:hypothetical protein